MKLISRRVGTEPRKDRVRTKPRKERVGTKPPEKRVRTELLKERVRSLVAKCAGMKPFTKRVLIVNAAALALALVCLAVCLSLSGRLESQKAAARWAGDGAGDYAQLSCFMGGSDSLDLGQIYTFRLALENRMAEEALEFPENARPYADAWSAVRSLNVSGAHGSGRATATAVGGDFFFFHPFRLLSGSYIAEGDYMDDRVVLDRELAWRLYGSDDLAGLTVEVEGVPFVVAGVIDRDRDSASQKAQSASMGLYLSYSAYRRLENADEAIGCYEIVMPEPVRGFAESFMKEQFPLGGGELVVNSGRFGVGGSWSILRDFGTRSMRLTDVVYPDWENAARYLGDWCALLLGVALALALCPAVTVCAALGLGLIRGCRYLAKKLPALVSEAVDRSRKKRYARRKETKG